MAKVLISEKWEIISLEWKKWFENQKTFLAPLGMFYVAHVIAQITLDGIGFRDFLPNNSVLSAMGLYLLNAAFDLFKKWSGEKKYTV